MGIAALRERPQVATRKRLAESLGPVAFDIELRRLVLLARRASAIEEGCGKHSDCDRDAIRDAAVLLGHG